VIPKYGTYALLGDGKVKIGKSGKDLLQRVRGIQLQSPTPLKLIGTLPTDVETEIHRELSPHHLFGEWFEAGPALELVARRFDPQDVDLMPTVAGTTTGRRANSMKTHCKRGHELTQENCSPDVWSRGQRICLVCKTIQGREYREKNRDRLRENHRRWMEKNPTRKRDWVNENREHVSEYNRGYREQNRERLVENSRSQYAQNRDEMREYHAKWRAENRQAARRATSEWAKRNRDKINAARRARNAARRSAAGG
jgi:hypothetical protein